MTKCISNGFHHSNTCLTFQFEPKALHEQKTKKKQQLTAVMTIVQNVLKIANMI